MACCTPERKKMVLRYTATIEKPVTSGADAYNQIELHSDSNWETHATRRIGIRPATVREQFASDEEISLRTAIIGMWGDSTTRQLSATYRVKYTDEDSVVHKYSIVGVNVYEEGKWIECQCVEVHS